MPKPDIHRLLELQTLLLQFQSVERTLHLPASHDHRLENDVEHSYSLAMCAWFLASYFPNLDRDLLIRFALVHDLVEVYAGDTFAFGKKSDLKSKAQREAAALKRLEKEWNDFPDMLATIERYESHAGEEAIFIRALDKIMPMMINCLSGGYTWKKFGLNIEQLHANKNATTSISPAINDYYQQLYKIMLNNPQFFPTSKA